MHSVLNIKKFLLFILFICLSSCTIIVRDPARKYNKEFLAKNKFKIRRAKNKHTEIAKEYGIYYTDDATTKLVDTEYYSSTPSTSKKKNFLVRSKSANATNIANKNMTYVGDDKTIYKRETNLKDDKLSSLKEEDDIILYLENNYDNYRTEKNINRGVALTPEQIYGTKAQIKEKPFNSIDNEELLVSFDYIDLISRIRNDIYIQEQQGNKVIGSDKKQDGVINSIKEKFMNLFKGNKK